MDSGEVITSSAEKGIELTGSSDAQQTTVGVITAFRDKLLPAVEVDEEPGVLAPTYLLCDGRHLGAGVALVLEDRAILGWMKGLLKRPVIEAVPLARIEAVEPGSKPAGGRLAKPLESIRLKSGKEWELLFTQDAGGTRLRDALAALLAGEPAP